MTDAPFDSLGHCVRGLMTSRFVLPLLVLALGSGVFVRGLGAQTEPGCTDPLIVNPSFEDPQIPGPWTLGSPSTGHLRCQPPPPTTG